MALSLPWNDPCYQYLARSVHLSIGSPLHGSFPIKLMI